MNSYYIIHKPFQVLSQFTSHEGKQTLKDFFDVPHDVYAVGRLDYDSEGLLILTNDKTLNHLVLQPAMLHEREYWVQVEGNITSEAVGKLGKGIDIAVDGKVFRTSKCKVEKMMSPDVAPRNPPIRVRKNIPESWIKLVMTEGKNRQVRKMTAKAGFPTLRLIRYRIEKVTIEGLAPGEMQMLTQGEIYNLLKIKNNIHAKIDDRVWKGRANR